jgi:hypothetical protein
VSITPEGNADKTGRITQVGGVPAAPRRPLRRPGTRSDACPPPLRRRPQGDQLIATSGVVYNTLNDYGGVSVKGGQQVVRMTVQGEVGRRCLPPPASGLGACRRAACLPARCLHRRAPAGGRCRAAADAPAPGTPLAPQPFKAVSAAIGSHPGHIPVTLEFQQCAKD